jgi:hypothetical protein
LPRRAARQPGAEGHHPQHDRVSNPAFDAALAEAGGWRPIDEKDPSGHLAKAGVDAAAVLR